MSKTNKIQYGIVDFAKKKKLKVTAQQYLYLDSIKKLQADPKGKGYAYASNDYYAEMYDLSSRAISKMTTVLVEKGWIERGKGSNRKVTQECYDIMTFEDEQSSGDDRTKFNPTTNKVHGKHEQSSPNNNSNKNTNNNSDKNTHPNPLVEQNRAKAREYKKELEERITFKNLNGQAYDYFQDYVNRELINDLVVFPPWNELQNKRDFLKNHFFAYNAGNTWKDKEDLKRHIINSIKSYRPTQQAEQNGKVVLTRSKNVVR